MAKIVARFADGRLLVQEERTVETCYGATNVAVRVGLLKEVEEVLSIDAYMSGNPEVGKLETQLKEVTTSGDTILVTLRRNDLPLVLSGFASGGLESYGVMSGVTSGQGFHGRVLSGIMPISGQLNVLANVVGH